MNSECKILWLQELVSVIKYVKARKGKPLQRMGILKNTYLHVAREAEEET
jgi:hypothetical protein